MAVFVVTTAQTVYEAYVVRADAAKDARRIVSDPARRAALESAEVGGNDDESVIDVKEV